MSSGGWLLPKQLWSASFASSSSYIMPNKNMSLLLAGYVNVLRTDICHTHPLLKYFSTPANCSLGDFWVNKVHTKHTKKQKMATSNVRHPAYVGQSFANEKSFLPNLQHPEYMCMREWNRTKYKLWTRKVFFSPVQQILFDFNDARIDNWKPIV